MIQSFSIPLKNPEVDGECDSYRLCEEYFHGESMWELSKIRRNAPHFNLIGFFCGKVIVNVKNPRRADVIAAFQDDDERDGY